MVTYLRHIGLRHCLVNMISLHSLICLVSLAAWTAGSVLGTMLVLLRRIGTEGCKRECQLTCGCQSVAYSTLLLECDLMLTGDNSGYDSAEYNKERRCNISMVKLTNRKGEELYVYKVVTGCENIPQVNYTERIVRISGAEVTAEYTCVSPLTLAGLNKVIKCDEKRKWSDTDVRCKEAGSFLKNIHTGLNKLPLVFSVGRRIVVHLEPIHPSKWSISFCKKMEILAYMEWRYTKKTLKNTKCKIFLIDGKGRHKCSEELPFNIKQSLTIQFERNETDYVIVVENSQHLLGDQLPDDSADGITVSGIPIKDIQIV